MAAKVTVGRNSQSTGLGTRTEAGVHPSTQGFTYAIQEHGGGTAHSITSDCGSNQGGRHPSSAPYLVQKKVSPPTPPHPRDRVKVNFSNTL